MAVRTGRRFLVLDAAGVRLGKFVTFESAEDAAKAQRGDAVLAVQYKDAAGAWYTDERSSRRYGSGGLLSWITQY